MDLKKFPSIEQFRHVIAEVTSRAEFVGKDEHGDPIYDSTKSKPTLDFTGTVKLHGSNHCIAFDCINNTIEASSRDVKLSANADPLKFYAWAMSINCELLKQAVIAVVGQAYAIHIYGEWCGPQINIKAGIGHLPTRWVIFAVHVENEDGGDWISVSDVAEKYTGNEVYFITNYKQFHCTIDFNSPDQSLELLETITNEVETLCPVAAAMGGGGIGEGIVWTGVDPKHGIYRFKTKGSKHKGTKTAQTVELTPEILQTVDQFVNTVITENRLQQGLDVMKANNIDVTRKNVGSFLQWIGQDVLKEDFDIMAVNGIDRKLVMPKINKIAKSWYDQQL